MLYGILGTLFSLSCILLILLVLVQKSKSSLGIGNISGSNQMLFGGSGGQDILQKITWGLGALLIAGSLGLSLLRSLTYEGPVMKQPMTQAPMPVSFD